MKNNLAHILLLIALGLTMLAPAAFAQAGSLTLPAPPAYTKGDRIGAEAVAAAAYADLLQSAGRGPDAAFQREIAARRSYQAIAQYTVVTASATYRHTAFAAEAVYKSAVLEGHYVPDGDLGHPDWSSAFQMLKGLHYKYADVEYPDRAEAEAERERLGKLVDSEYQHFEGGFFGHLRPILYRIMDAFVSLFGRRSYSYFLAILAISLLVKIALVPLANKQYASMREMQKIAPLVKELQAKHKNDPTTFMTKQRELYQEHNVNQFGGCLPTFIQLPFLLLLLQMIIAYQYHFTAGHFLWIGSALSRIYPSFIAANLGQPDILLLGLYGISMYIQQKMITPPATDPQQAEQQKMMYVMMPMFSMWAIYSYNPPSAFVLYYLISNILGTGQQLIYMKKHGPAIVPAPGPNPVKVEEQIEPADKPYSANGTESALRRNGTSHSAKASDSTPGVRPKVHPKKKKR